MCPGLTARTCFPQKAVHIGFKVQVRSKSHSYYISQPFWILLPLILTCSYTIAAGMDPASVQHRERNDEAHTDSSSPRFPDRNLF